MVPTMPSSHSATTTPRSGVSWVIRVEPGTNTVVVGAVLGADGGAVVVVVGGSVVIVGRLGVVTPAVVLGGAVVVVASDAVVEVDGAVVVVEDVGVVTGNVVVVVAALVVVVVPPGSGSICATAIVGVNDAVATARTASVARARLTCSPGTSRCHPRTGPRAC